MAPPPWLPFSLDTDHHLAVLLFVAALGSSMLPGLATIARSVTGDYLEDWAPVSAGVMRRE
ncbi:MAG: hypothetical protein FJ090_15205 [Deltaproteobacteria bacterium]|nr:hypothetical protein [Deltaproteobacteria bacterium]